MNTIKRSFSEDDLKKIRELEQKRILRGYKQGWIYHKACSLNLLEPFYYLQNKGEICKNNINETNNVQFCISKLTIETVPETSWYKNVRSSVTDDQWSELKKITSKKSNYKCAICGGCGPKWPVECHEIWDYDDTNKIQKLGGLIALCPSCHEVKHIGLAILNGKGETAMKHLAKINKWSFDQAKSYINESRDIWMERSRYQWRIDMDWLKQYGINIIQSQIENIPKQPKKTFTNTYQQTKIDENIENPIKYQPRKSNIISKVLRFFYDIINK